MLPKGPLGRDMFRKMKVFAGLRHNHAALAASDLRPLRSITDVGQYYGWPCRKFYPFVFLRAGNWQHCSKQTSSPGVSFGRELRMIVRQPLGDEMTEVRHYITVAGGGIEWSSWL
jgi:hypothetical protein